MADDLLIFLKARLAEDQRTAESLLRAARRFDRQPDFYGFGGPAAQAHWQRFGPARVLAEVAAKRSAILEYESVVESLDDYDSADCMWRALISSLRGVLKADASVYADHPDYQEAWRP